MVNTRVNQIYHKIHSAEDALGNAKSMDEKVALGNYIGNLYNSVGRVLGNDIEADMLKVFKSSKQYKKFIKRLDFYEFEMLDHFILKKKVHNAFIGDCMFDTGDSLEALGERERTVTTVLSDKDFYDIFWQFMRSLHLEQLFEKYVKEGKIYNTHFDEVRNNVLGYTVFNPMEIDTDIFIGDFHNDIDSMFTLAHEFGHVYDFNEFQGDIKDYNQYFYQSFYGEVFSRAFEKLFLDYLIQNNILLEEAKDKLFETSNINYEYLLGAYMLTLVPDDYLKYGHYEGIDKESFVQLVKYDFEDEDVIRNYIMDSTYFSVSEDLTYSYGSILSFFVKNAIDEGGFKHPFIRDFLKIRTNMFQESFLEKENITPAEYIKYHDEGIKILKK